MAGENELSYLAGTINAIQKQVGILRIAGGANVQNYGAKTGGIIDNKLAFQSAFNALPNGGIAFFPTGDYKISDTLNLKSGITYRGAGKNPTTGGTILRFEIPSASVGLSGNAVDDINIEDMFITFTGACGRAAATEHDIKFWGGHRINFRNVIITTDNVNYDAVRYENEIIESQIHELTIVGGRYGLFIEAGATCITIFNSYAQLAKAAGFYLDGTYISVIGGAVDGCLNGYLILGSQIGLHNCGVETSTRTGVVLLNASGISLIGMRSHLNNTGANAAYPSFLDIRNSDHISSLDCRDSSPTAGTIYSVDSTTADAGKNILFVNPRFDLSMPASLLAAPRISEHFYIGGKRHTYGTAVPAAGTWIVGDICWHSDAAAGEPMGWQCTGAGTPGTWKAMANLAA